MVIPGGNRTELLDKTVPELVQQGFDDLIVAGDYHSGPGYRYLYVPAMTRTTNDALIKRDVGTLATRADVIVYLADDHRLDPEFLLNLKTRYYYSDWDVLIPFRYCMREGKAAPLNNGQLEGYCGGHAGVYRRVVIEACPWTAGPHHRNWDLIHSRWHQREGFKYVASEVDLAVEDIEPGARPWV